MKPRPRDSVPAGPIADAVLPDDPLHAAPARIVVWKIALDSADASGCFEAILSPDELERANRFRFSVARDRFVAGRAALRKILAFHLDDDPHSLRFVHSGKGKPELAASVADRLHFNLSHSGDLAILAVTRIGEIGADVEQVLPRDEWEPMARRFFAEREFAALMALPAEKRLRAFYTIWTRKEAYLKARGAGLSLSLATFAVSVDPDDASPRWTDLENPSTEPPWRLIHLDLGANFVGALAIGQPHRALVIRDWPIGASGEV